MPYCSAEEIQPIKCHSESLFIWQNTPHLRPSLKIHIFWTWQKSFDKLLSHLFYDISATFLSLLPLFVEFSGMPSINFQSSGAKADYLCLPAMYHIQPWYRERVCFRNFIWTKKVLLCTFVWSWQNYSGVQYNTTKLGEKEKWK